MRSIFHLTRTSIFVIFSVALVFTSCDNDLVESDFQNHSNGIIGGSLESGWPAVGALTSAPGGSYWGSFCTATLIDQSWVLTAAHCVSSYSASSTYFMVGTDANPDGTGSANNGVHYATDAAYVHPSYDENLHVNDVALVHLAAPLTTVQPIAINTAGMTSSLVGSSVFYVGFGATAGSGPSESGEKRSAFIDIAYVGIGMYSGDYEGTGICFGDSGGPGLLQFDSSGPYYVIGVNSTVSNSSGDPCKGKYNHVRVDQYAAWINMHIGAPEPSCTGDADLCFCEDACESTGECDNEICKEDDCGELYNCFVSCDYGACQVGCYLNSTDLAIYNFQMLLECLSSNCDGMTNSDWWNCFQTTCGSQVAQCFDIDLCDIMGGDCNSTGACHPSDLGLTDCVPSNGIGLGESCSLGALNPLDCGDGLVCKNDSEFGSVCRKLCSEDVTCSTGDCIYPAFSNYTSDVGYCKSDFNETDTDTNVDSGVPSDGDISDSGTNGSSGSSDCDCNAADSKSRSGLVEILLSFF